MDSSAIIDKIIADAKARAESLIACACAEAEKISAQARAEAESRREAALAEARAEAGALIKNRLALAALEVKRGELNTRQSEVGGVYDALRRSLFALSGDGYRSLISKMLNKYARDGDTVVAGASDYKKLDAAFVGSAAKSRNIRLNFASAPGDFDGGIKLINPVCDSNLTFDSLIAELRQATETEVARMIYKNL